MSSRFGRGLDALRHPIAQNAVALYLSQFVLTALPLVTLPWMARALGASELGRVLFTQSFSFMLAMLIEYGFQLSGSRDVARVRDDAPRLARTVAGVTGAKLALVGLATVVALAAALLVPIFRQDPWLAVFGWVMATLQGLTPLWYFQGVERLRLTAALDAATRIGTAVAIVLLVREPGDGHRVLWIWTLGLVTSTGLLTWLMYRSTRPQRPAVSDIRAALVNGRSLFVNTAAVSLYTTATVVLLGLVVSSAQVALFASAERIVRAALRGISPVGAATYPRVAYLLAHGRTQRAQQLATAALGAITGVGAVIALVLVIAAPALVRLLFGPGFATTTEILRTLALLVPLVACASTLSGQWLFPRGLERVVIRVSLAAGLGNVVLTLLVGSTVGIRGVGWVLVGLEGGVAASLGLAIHRRRLFPNLDQLRGRLADAP